MKFVMTLLLSALAIGCGSGSSYNLMTGGTSVPQITQLSPFASVGRQSWL